MNSRTILVWFRNDLRVHDNEVLLSAIEKGGQILPVYCFDNRHYSSLNEYVKKTGINRANFILNNVSKLRDKLRELGSDLIICQGEPEVVIPQICEEYGVDEVYHHREVAFEETQLSNKVEAALWKKQINLRHFIGHTLYHKEDLPFPIKDIPDSFNVFKKKAERESFVRPFLQAPEKISSPELKNEYNLPSLEDLGYDSKKIETLKNTPFEGGEDLALKLMKDYLTNPNNQFKDTQLSPYIALGVLSTCRFYHEIQNSPLVKNNKKWSEQLITGLLWRDYYRFMFKKHGNKFFKLEGFSSQPAEEKAWDLEKFLAWTNGETGDPTIDEGMNLLNETGYISDQMRTILASYWVNIMDGNWLKGAEWFEEKLIDYAPSSNYGNWAHIAGVGSSAKENKPVNLKKLIENYK